MNTINKSFNYAWEQLAKYHPTAHLPSGESLDISEYPLGIKPAKKRRYKATEWQYYINDLATVLVLGYRNKFLHTHVDGAGRTAYLYVPEDIATGKNKLPWVSEAQEGGTQEHIT